MKKLDEIKENLDGAQSLIRKAARIAKQANDSKGHQDCEKMAEQVENLRNDFADKGK